MMRTALLFTLVLSTTGLLAAACGGETEDETSQVSASGAGGSVGAGGQAAAGASGKGGSGAGQGGSGGTAGAGQAGSGQAGQGQAGAGQAGQGQAGMGQAGMGQAGMGQAGMGQAGWAACTGPGQCTLAYAGCCPGCGKPGPSAFDGVNVTKIKEHFDDVCAEAPVGCPGCVPEPNPDLAAFCEASTCKVVEVSKHPISACKADSDCIVRGATCCACQTSPDNLIAVTVDGSFAYDNAVCEGGMGCQFDCVPQMPEGFKATCDQGTGHCKVEKKVPTVCPVDPPVAGAACPVEAQACEYGSDPRPGCRQLAQCQQGAWQVLLAKCPGLVTPGEQGCPATPAGAGATCQTQGSVCDLGLAGQCECGPCTGGPCLEPDPSMPPAWVCASPAPPPCPPLLPNLGQPCSLAEGTMCMYGIGCAATSGNRVCSGGVWVDNPVACPL